MSKKYFIALVLIFTTSILSFANDAFINIAGLGNLALVQRHIDNGVDVNAKHTEDGKTALIIAAEKGHLEIIKLLINSGANINTTDNFGYNSLMYATNNEHTEVANFLIEFGAKVTIANIISICDSRAGLESISKLLKTGNINYKDSNGYTALINASFGKTEIAKLLILAGADVNARSNDGHTPLMYASGPMGSDEVIKVLISAGADINTKTSYGTTILMLASCYSSNEIVEQLISLGADVNAKENNGGTALMFASENRNTEIVKTLIDAGADVNAKITSGDQKDYTALMIASQSGHVEGVKLLINEGADVNAKDSRGSTALSVICQYADDINKNNKSEIERILKAAGAR